MVELLPGKNKSCITCRYYYRTRGVCRKFCGVCVSPGLQMYMYPKLAILNIGQVPTDTSEHKWVTRWIAEHTEMTANTKECADYRNAFDANRD